jgi:2-oxoglutarate ferredoxin oxidoreductase subunit delta
MTTKSAALTNDVETSRSGENPITTYPAWCKRCGICVAFCPKSVLEAGPDGHPRSAHPEDCIRCHMCELRCPDFAISVADAEDVS